MEQPTDEELKARAEALYPGRDAFQEDVVAIWKREAAEREARDNPQTDE